MSDPSKEPLSPEKSSDNYGGNNNDGVDYNPGKTVKVRHCDETDKDIVLYYEEYGNPTDPVLLFIEGLGVHCWDWDKELLDKFIPKGFRVIRFDNRDVGASTKIVCPEPKLWKFLLPACCCCCCPEKAPYTLDAMAKDAVSLMDALEIQKAHIIGQSMGGMIAQLVALNYPERVHTATFVFTNTGNRGIKDPPFSSKLWLVKKPKTKNFDDVLEFQNGIEDAILANAQHAPSEEPRRARVLKNLKRSHYRDGGANQAAAIVTAPQRDNRLKNELKLPVLIVHGENDALVPFENGTHLHKCIPHSKMVPVEGMGHCIGPREQDIIVEELVEMAVKYGHSNSN